MRESKDSHHFQLRLKWPKFDACDERSWPFNSSLSGSVNGFLRNPIKRPWFPPSIHGGVGEELCLHRRTSAFAHSSASSAWRPSQPVHQSQRRTRSFNPVSSNPHDHSKKFWWSYRKRSFIIIFPERKIRRMWLNNKAQQYQCWFRLYLWIYSPLALSIKPSHQWRTPSNFLSCKQGRRQGKTKFLLDFVIQNKTRSKNN